MIKSNWKEAKGEKIPGEVVCRVSLPVYKQAREGQRTDLVANRMPGTSPIPQSGVASLPVCDAAFPRTILSRPADHSMIIDKILSKPEGLRRISLKSLGW